MNEDDFLQLHDKIDSTVKHIVELATQDSSQVERILSSKCHLKSYDCYEPVMRLFDQRCFDISQVWTIIRDFIEKKTRPNKCYEDLLAAKMFLPRNRQWNLSINIISDTALLKIWAIHMHSNKSSVPSYLLGNSINEDNYSMMPYFVIWWKTLFCYMLIFVHQDCQTTEYCLDYIILCLKLVHLLICIIS